jgi:hypothetical protein
MRDYKIYVAQGRHGIAVEQRRGIRKAEIGNAESDLAVRALSERGPLTLRRDIVIDV